MTLSHLPVGILPLLSTRPASQSIGRYQIILLDDRGTCIRAACSRLLPWSRPAEIQNCAFLVREWMLYRYSTQATFDPSIFMWNIHPWLFHLSLCVLFTCRMSHWGRRWCQQSGRAWGSCPGSSLDGPLMIKLLLADLVLFAGHFWDSFVVQNLSCRLQVSTSRYLSYLGMGAILRVFTLQGWHVAPIQVKFGVDVHSSVPVITPHRCRDRGIGPPQKKKIILSN